MPVRTRRVALGLAAAAALAGCSSAGPPRHASSSVSSPISPPTTYASAPGAGTGAPADPATKRAVSRAYAIFFDAKTPLARSQTLLQHGARFRAALIAEGKSSQAQGAGAKVTAVNRISPDVAYVTFTVTSGGSPLLSGERGYAVRENGAWKVAAKTFCALLQLQGNPPGACNDPSVIALPH
jgi:hypothetical protein